MSRISRNISIIYRAERAIARRRLAVARNQTGMMAFAGVMAAIGVVMLNLSAFLALEGPLSAPGAALIVALVNLALAGALVSAAGRMDADAELGPITELRDLAQNDLEAEIEHVATEARDIANSVRSLARDPLGAAGVGAIGPLLAFLVKALRK